jgi:hypothetical protein
MIYSVECILIKRRLQLQLLRWEGVFLKASLELSHHLLWDAVIELLDFCDFLFHC